MGEKLKLARVEVRGQTLVITFSSEYRVLSSAPLNGGLTKAKTVINHQVDKNYDHKNPEGLLESVATRLGVERPVVGLMTAAPIDKYAVSSVDGVEAIVTAGVGSGTVNMVVLIDGNLTGAAMVNTVLTAVEARSRAFHQLDIWKRGSKLLGTETDAIVIACTGRGDLIRYAGPASKVGFKVYSCVLEAVKGALEKTEGLTGQRSFLKRLKERGIDEEELVKVAGEMYTPHPGLESRNDFLERVRKRLREVLSDVNVVSLVMAGFRLEEDGLNNLLPGLPAEEFRKDPVHLVADETLGMALACYIAGLKGLFEYVRYEKVKPGILSKLGPFLDDVLAALVAGVSSLVYSEGLRKRKNESD